MKKNYGKWIAGIALTGIVTIAGLMQTSADLSQAAEKLNVSAKEYSLPVESLPQSVEGKVYAKLHDTKKDAADYQLALYDSYDALIGVENALKQAGEKVEDIEYLAVEVALYESDGAGDYYPAEAVQAMSVICPVPEELADDAKRLQMVAVSSTGKLERIDSELVTVNGTECVKFDAYSEKVYAFLVKEGGTLTSGIKVTPTPTPKPTVKPTATPKPTVTPEPTKKAEKKPTATTAPEKKPTVTPKPTRAAGNTVNADKKSTPTPKPEKTTAPTKKPAAAAPQKDKTPQTGDDFRVDGAIVMLLAGAVICAGSVIISKRSVREKKY